MGRFTEIALPKDFIDYSRKLPEALLYKAAQDLDKKAAETDTLSAGINKLFDIKLAPSQQSQEDYKRITSSYIKEKNEINDAAMKDPSNIAQHNARIKQLASKISDDATAGQLKALKEQGEQYWGNIAAKQTIYKDNPELFNLYKKDYDAGFTNSTYNTDLIKYGNVEEPMMYANVDPKEMQDWASKQITTMSKFENANEMNVRRLLSGATSDLVGVTGQDRKTAERLKEMFRGSVPQEFVNSFNQYNRATGYIDPTTGQTIDESKYWDSSTNSFNKTTRLGRALDAAVIQGEQEDVQITTIPNAGSIRNKGGNGDSDEEPKSNHTWSIHSSINSLLTKRDAAVKANPLDVDTISGFETLIKQAANDITGQVLNVEYWKKNPQYTNIFQPTGNQALNPYTGAPITNSTKSQIVMPFVKHRTGTKERPNVFEPSDFIIDFGAGTAGMVYIRNKGEAPTSYVNPTLGDYKVSNNTAVKTRVFDLSKPEDIKHIKNIVFLDGFITQNYGQAKATTLQNFDEPDNEE